MDREAKTRVLVKKVKFEGYLNLSPAMNETDEPILSRLTVVSKLVKSVADDPEKLANYLKTKRALAEYTIQVGKKNDQGDYHLRGTYYVGGLKEETSRTGTTFLIGLATDVNFNIYQVLLNKDSDGVIDWENIKINLFKNAMEMVISNKAGMI